MQSRIHIGLAILLGSGLTLADRPAAIAQNIVGGAPNTTVNQVGNQFDITGGFNAGNNTFFSFEQFSLNTNQTANFQVGGTVENVMARVMGGSPSNIYGTLQVTGGTSPNLYLMNPAGIVFGPGATINIPGAFTATTANGMQFSGSWFSADRSSTLDSTLLTGNPTAFGFTMDQPAAIINAASLKTDPNSGAIALIGGTVISPGKLEASSSIQIATAPGKSIIQRILPSNPELLPQFSIQSFTTGASQPTNWTSAVPTLPQLITGAGPDGLPIRDVTGLQTNPDGSVKLIGSNININPGDVFTGAIATDGVLINAPQGNVTVETIRAKDLGVDITAGKLFRAIGILPGATSYTNPFKVLINQPNSELLNFLILKTGLSAQEIKDKFSSDSNRFSPTVSASSAASIFVSRGVSAGEGNVSIRYGGGSQLIAPKAAGVGPTVTGNAPFSLGGKATLTSPDLADRYQFVNPGKTFDDLKASSPTDPINNSASSNFDLRRNQTSEIVPIPESYSGTVGEIIQIVVVDGSLTASFQSQLFGELPTAKPSPTPTTPITPTVATESLSPSISAPETVDRAESCSSQTKASNRAGTTCTTTSGNSSDSSDDVILKILE
jgi:filamentous hemagglutinin family protein